MKRRPDCTYFTLLRCKRSSFFSTVAHPGPDSYLEHYPLQGSVNGIVVQGSNGEAQHLSSDERKRVICLTRATLDAHEFQHIDVIAGTGAQSTRETKQLNVDAKEAGATYALILTPSTWKSLMTKDLILRFFREVWLSFF
jgi:dihydrodipicolinate synthase/N-acetylneuraminate lyase